MEFLKELLGEELYKQVEEKLKGNDKVKLANLATGEYVAKAKFDATESSLKELKSQVEERDKQLKDLKKNVGDNEELKTKLSELEEANKKTKEEYESKLQAQAFEHALDGKLIASKVKNPKAVKALLDLEKVSQDGENLIGLEEQLTALKASDNYLFEVEGDTGEGTNPGDTKNPAGELTDDERSAMWGGVPLIK